MFSNVPRPTTPDLLLCSSSMQTLQRTLREEQGARKLAESNHRRARNASARTNRYLDSILKVNQDLVTARTGTSTTPPFPSTAKRSTSTHETREPSRLRRRKTDRKQQLQGPIEHDAVHGFDISTAVEEALRVGRAGGDPALSLQALYERIGFSALQAGGGDGGFNSLPTSPSRARAVRTFEEASLEDEERFSCTRWPRDIEDSFFSKNRVESSWNPDPTASARRTSIRGSPKRNSGRGRGSREGGSPEANGYSFAHSPTSKPTSVAERSPDVVRRLEDMASQLERDREDMNQWYKTVVHRVGSAGWINNYVDTLGLCPSKSARGTPLRHSTSEYQLSDPSTITSPCRLVLKYVELSSYNIHSASLQSVGTSSYFPHSFTIAHPCNTPCTGESNFARGGRGCRSGCQEPGEGDRFSPGEIFSSWTPSSTNIEVDNLIPNIHGRIVYRRS